jgi:hypothetical protein
MFTVNAVHDRQTARRSHQSPSESGDSVKRIYLVGAAMAALLCAALTTAPAFATSAAKKPASVKTKTVVKNTLVTTNMTCSIKLATQIPSDDVTVTQGAASGTQSGSAGCAKPLFRGVQQDSFLQDDSGDLSGKYQQWYNAGSVYGMYTLTPEDTGPPTTTSFTAASYTGTITVTDGTGFFKQATGTGTLACATTDSAHYTCTEKLKLVQTVPATVTTKAKTKTKS